MRYAGYNTLKEFKRKADEKYVGNDNFNTEMSLREELAGKVDIKFRELNDSLDKLETELGDEAEQREALSDDVSDIQAYIGYTDDDIYGLEVDFKNNRFTRLAGTVGKNGGSDFNSIPPWNRRRCILADDGTVVAYYGNEGYIEDGSKGQVMVEQPIFYIKVVPLGAEAAASDRGKQYTKARYYISATPKAGFEPMHGFRDSNGDLQDKIYLSAYEGCIQKEEEYLKDDEQTADFERDKLSSIAGAKPASGLAQLLTRANSRKLANNRGEGWQLHNIFALSVTQILMLIEYASFDCQGKVGKGVSGLTDDKNTNMAVVTGDTSELGNSSGGTDDGEYSVSYRGEENVWGNIWTWLDGINVHNDKATCESAIYLKEYGKYTDDTAEGYNRVEFDPIRKNGYQSALGIDSIYPELSLPTEASGYSNLPISAYWWNEDDGWRLALLGGNWDKGGRCSAWYYSLDSLSLNCFRAIGGRLLYIPQSKEEKS